MKIFAKCRKKSARRGFSLVEVIIALTVITVVSAATLVLIFSSVSAEEKSLMKMNIVTEAETAVECFRFARNAETSGNDFFSLLLASDKGYKQDENNANHFFLTKQDYVLHIHLSDSPVSITISVKDYSNNDIYTLEYKPTYT